VNPETARPNSGIYDMTATLIDGAQISRKLLDDLRPRLASLKARGITPGLAAILVGENAASEVYVRNKIRACADLGLTSTVHRLGAACTDADVVALIEQLNNDAAVHGILLQLPLPDHLDADAAMHRIAAKKDVDGFSWENLGALVAGHPRLAPCTAMGIMAMIDHEGIVLEGCNAVVIGRSVAVGKPTALMLIGRGATVTVCSSKTRDLARHVRAADLVVVAVGKAGTVDGSMLKPGSAVFDVGINRMADGKITGDVDFASASLIASRITPVPGGVGRMTVAALIANTVTAAEFERAVRVQPAS
jgi:methylenetetrahydrofolate dehydrogenase (NADP+)/methenyltetrahydrofolate cyclohydrolase